MVSGLRQMDWRALPAGRIESETEQILSPRCGGRFDWCSTPPGKWHSLNTTAVSTNKTQPPADQTQGPDRSREHRRNRDPRPSREPNLTEDVRRASRQAHQHSEGRITVQAPPTIHGNVTITQDQIITQDGDTQQQPQTSSVGADQSSNHMSSPTDTPDLASTPFPATSMNEPSDNETLLLASNARSEPHAAMEELSESQWALFLDSLRRKAGFSFVLVASSTSSLCFVFFFFFSFFFCFSSFFF